MAEPVDLDARLDDLFATEPQQFTAARDALVRDLKADDRAEDADAVKALRRPTIAIAAINQAARQEPGRVAALVETGEQLAALQANTNQDRDELRELTRERRALLQQLTDVAANSTARPEGVRAAITATLDAASLDDALRDDLLRGRLTQELSPVARFVADENAPAPRAVAPRRTTKKAAPPPRDELAARRARAELDAVRERAQVAEKSMREHADAAAEATAALDAAQRRVADLEAALADARADLAEAKRAERDAQRAETRARTERERVDSALRAAQRAVDETE
jgi:chromosome segregation ATPase